MIPERLDQPDLKCVQRSEIASRCSSIEPSALDAASRKQLEDSYHQKLRDWFVHKNELDTRSGAAGGDVILEPCEDAFQFRLFSKKAALFPEAQRIVLRSPTPTNQNPGFLVPSRPDSYYFTNALNIEKIQQYQQAAVTGDDIMKGLKDIWYGSGLPWRVTTVRLAGSSKLSDPWLTVNETSHRKKRNGKRRRILIRKQTAIQLKAATSKSEIEAAKKEKRARRNSEKKERKKAIKEAMGLNPGMTKAEEEVALKEKRTRRNREKKVKKKQRDKLKKTSSIDQLG